jgi:eukaryotic-like serine/threonine-protein kinase
MSAPVNVGDKVAGKYLVERVLGEGGMGVVVAARHLQLGERVAIKFLLPHALDQRNVVARFLREGSTVARLRSEYVARVHDVGALDDGAPYIVMEYLEGKNLAAVLQERGPMEIRTAVKYVLQACEGVAEAHAMGVVHRDIKPENLVVIRRRDGTSAIKLIDFGVSKLMPTEPQELGITAPSMTLGSPRYMAPEQMSSARDVDTRADVWSIGAVLYHLLSGAPPFQGNSIVSLFVSINSGATSLRKARPEIPEGLDAAVLRCLQLDRTQRFADVAKLAAALVPFGPPHAHLSAEIAARILGGASETGPMSELLAPPAAEAQASLGTDPTIQGVCEMPATVPVPSITPAPAPVPAPARASVPAAPAEAVPAPPRDESGEGVETAVRRALSQLGIAGKVLLQGQDIALYGAGPPTVIDAEKIKEQWALLPPEMQARKAQQLASRLAAAHRAVAANQRAPQLAGGTSQDWLLVGRLAAGVLAIGAVTFGLRFAVRSRDVPQPAQAAAETPEQRRQRLDTACRASRLRVYNGASIGPFDTAGWTVELWLAGRARPAEPAPSAPPAKPGVAARKPAPNKPAPPSFSAAALRSVVSGDRFAPGADEVLSQVDDGTVVITEEAELPASPGWRTATALLGGGYARAFFETDARARLVSLADRVHEATGAELGALYARCAELQVHDVGAWFRGRDAGGAATALLFAMGMSAERPQIDRAALSRASAGGELDTLRASLVAAKVDAGMLRGLVGQQGGSMAAEASGVSVTFAVGAPLRAVVASREVAAKAGVGAGE